MAGILVHLGVGFLGAVVLALFFPFLWGIPLFFVASAIWALLPDFPAVWGKKDWDKSPVMNIFWFHQIIDANVNERNLFY